MTRSRYQPGQKIISQLYSETEYEEYDILKDNKLFKKVFKSQRIQRKRQRRLILAKKITVSKISLKKHFVLSQKDQSLVLENLLVKNIP